MKTKIAFLVTAVLCVASVLWVPVGFTAFTVKRFPRDVALKVSGRSYVVPWQYARHRFVYAPEVARPPKQLRRFDYDNEGAIGSASTDDFGIWWPGVGIQIGLSSLVGAGILATGSRKQARRPAGEPSECR